MRSAAIPAAEGGLSIVVPVYNEAAGLAALHARLAEVAAALGSERGLACEIVYVDDGSRDASLATALALPANGIDVQVVSLSRNFGKEAALMAGLDHARLGAVLFMDADGQHPPALIETLVGHWLDDGYDVVYTAKAHRENESIVMRLGVKAFYSLINWGSRQPIPEDAGDFRLLSPRAAAALRQLPERNRFFKGLASWIGFRQFRVDYHPADRTHGRTSWNFGSLIGLSVEGLTSFSVAPLRIASLLGIMLAAGALGVRRLDPDRDLRLRADGAGLSLAHRRPHGDRRRAAADDRRDGRVHRQGALRAQGPPRLLRRRAHAQAAAKADDRPAAAEAARNAAE